MVVCRYYQQGHCRYGDNCWNEHPGAQNGQNTGFASQNRFSAFKSSTRGTGQSVRKDAPWNITTGDIKDDLTPGIGRPAWILSTYGPGKNAPMSLLDGNELSFEELRLRFYELKAGGNEMQAVNEANSLWSKAEQQIADVLNNVDKVVPFMDEADRKHPNRNDLLKMTGKISKEQIVKEPGSNDPFGGTSRTNASGFGTPTSAFGSAAPNLGTASTGPFGQPTQPIGFGARSTSQHLKPAFGQSGFGQSSSTPAFGKPGGGAFGQPSTFGQSTQPLGVDRPGFGQVAVKNPFVASSAAPFGQPSTTASAFGQTSQPTSGFGQTSLLEGGFGQPSKPRSGFAQLSRPSSSFGQPSQPPSSSGAPSNPFSTFGQPSQPAAAFGQSFQTIPAFGQPSQPASGFGQLAQPKLAFEQPPQSQSIVGQPAKSYTANLPLPAFGQTHSSQPTHKIPTNSSGSGNFSNIPFSQPSQPVSVAKTDLPNPFPTAPSSSASTLVKTSTPPPPTTQTFTAIAAASTTTPHPLTSKPSVPIHYTQTLPATGTTRFDPTTRRLTTYKNCRVQYIRDYPCYERPDGKGWERIWFPDGSAENVRLDDVQPKSENYTNEVKQAYRHLSETGRFEVGRLPNMAPLREWISFDF